MLIDVGDQFRNIALNACFYAILGLTIMAIVPWRAVGVVKRSRPLRWLIVPVFVLAVVYELLMPSRFDIRIDLLLLIPMYMIVAGASLIRWIASRRL